MAKDNTETNGVTPGEIPEVKPGETETATAPEIAKEIGYKATALLSIKFDGQVYAKGKEFTVDKDKVNQLKGYANIKEIEK